MNNQQEEIDLRDLLKQRVEAGETIFITGAGSSAALVATIEDLAREAGKTVRVVQFDVSPEVEDGVRAHANRAIAPKP